MIEDDSMEPLSPEERVDQIMAAIRREIKSRAEGREGTFSPEAKRLGGRPLTPDQLPRLGIPRHAPDPTRTRYHVNDFVGLDLELFLEHAFRIVLGREPDPESRTFFEERLRAGTMTPIDVLGHLRISPEGRTRGIKIRGLRPRFLYSRVTRRVPALGYLLRWAVDLLRLPSRLAALRQENWLLRDRLATVERGIDEIAAKLGSSLARIAETVNEFDLPSLESRLEVLSFSKAEAETVDHLLREVAEVHRLTRRLSLLESETLTASEGVPRQYGLYPSLEMEFRGTREDIKSRQTRYLEYVRVCTFSVQEYPALDLGCGRGEWLEILREAGIPGRGVEINPLMVQQCQELKLEVTEADVLDYLSALEPECLGFITAFHVVEHLEHEKLLNLLAQARRVLRSGGVLLLETPNPANLLVGACSFYLDPSHVKPLPADLLSFLVNSQGFIHSEVLFLHPSDSSQHLREEGELSERLNQLLYGPQDYAVLGYKP